MSEDEGEGRRVKFLKRGGVTSLPLKVLTHPLDRSISSAFLITLFFTLLALLSGVPVVILLCVLLPIGIFFKVLFSCYFFPSPSLCSLISPTSVSAASSSGPSSPVVLNPSSSRPSYDATYSHRQQLANHSSSSIHSSSSRQQQASSSGQHNKRDREEGNRHRNHGRNRSRGSRSSRPLYSTYPLIPVTPLESFWLRNDVTNNNKYGICNCLLFLDKTLSLDQLKDIIVSRVLCKDEFWKFSARLEYKGESLYIHNLMTIGLNSSSFP